MRKRSNKKLFVIGCCVVAFVCLSLCDARAEEEIGAIKRFWRRLINRGEVKKSVEVEDEESQGPVAVIKLDEGGEVIDPGAIDKGALEDFEDTKNLLEELKRQKGHRAYLRGDRPKLPPRIDTGPQLPPAIPRAPQTPSTSAVTRPPQAITAPPRIPRPPTTAPISSSGASEPEAALEEDESRMRRLMEMEELAAKKRELKEKRAKGLGAE